MNGSTIFLLLILAPLYIAFLVGRYKLYEKAGEAGWKGLIPIYGTLVHLKIIGRPSYWLGFCLIPGIGVIVYYGLIVDLLKVFGKYKFYQHAAGLLIPFVYFPYLGFKKEVEYIGTLDELPERKRSTTREWADAIVFAIFAVHLISCFWFLAAKFDDFDPDTWVARLEL